MSTKLNLTPEIQENVSLVLIIRDVSDMAPYCRTDGEKAYIEKKIKEKAGLISLNQYDRLLFLLLPEENKEGHLLRESFRKKGFKLYGQVQSEKLEHLQLSAPEGMAQPLLDLCEGLMLSSYRFDKYKKSAGEKSVLLSLQVRHAEVSDTELEELAHVVESTFYARNLVNEPAISLNAEKLSRSLKKMGKEWGFKVEVLEKDRIKALKMGGLLAVNTGSIDPPTFNVLEYKPDEALNEQPYVLVGKGVTYDTGGLSLKPSASMVGMKADMGGAAAVAGAFLAVVKNKLPIYLVGLIPATDNRPGGNAITPGDVITVSDGSTVEVLNTDAEGRLILADALAYARKYKPALVIDLATLTGAALAALGKEAAAMMGTASEVTRHQLRESGEETYERLVEFPLWDEYREYLKSDIADLKNIGGRTAGAITAGMFLRHFTDYPWIHLDIAPTAYLDAPDLYRGKNGTGTGVRLLYHFLKKLVKK
jgi:leucyl aminopeptidase